MDHDLTVLADLAARMQAFLRADFLSLGGEEGSSSSSSGGGGGGGGGGSGGSSSMQLRVLDGVEAGTVVVLNSSGVLIGSCAESDTTTLPEWTGKRLQLTGNSLIQPSHAAIVPEGGGWSVLAATRGELTQTFVRAGQVPGRAAQSFEGGLILRIHDVICLGMPRACDSSSSKPTTVVFERAPVDTAAAATSSSSASSSSSSAAAPGAARAAHALAALALGPSSKLFLGDGLRGALLASPSAQRWAAGVVAAAHGASAAPTRTLLALRLEAAHGRLCLVDLPSSALSDDDVDALQSADAIARSPYINASRPHLVQCIGPQQTAPEGAVLDKAIPGHVLGMCAPGTRSAALEWEDAAAASHLRRVPPGDLPPELTLVTRAALRVRGSALAAAADVSSAAAALAVYCIEEGATTAAADLLEDFVGAGTVLFVELKFVEGEWRLWGHLYGGRRVCLARWLVCALTLRVVSAHRRGGQCLDVGAVGNVHTNSEHFQARLRVWGDDEEGELVHACPGRLVNPSFSLDDYSHAPHLLLHPVRLGADKQGRMKCHAGGACYTIFSGHTRAAVQAAGGRIAQLAAAAQLAGTTVADFEVPLTLKLFLAL
jgi:hypothetical protein